MWAELLIISQSSLDLGNAERQFVLHPNSLEFKHYVCLVTGPPERDTESHTKSPNWRLLSFIVD